MKRFIYLGYHSIYMTLDNLISEELEKWESFESVRTDIDPNSETDETIKSPEMEIYPNHLNQYELFTSLYGNPKRIFYPCCGRDGTPIVAFPDSNLTYLDFTLIPEMFNGENVKLIDGMVENHEPQQKYDLVIIQNPGMSESLAVNSQVLTKDLRQGGYVIANNRHGNAKQLFYDEGFENVGRFTSQRDGYILELNFDGINETTWNNSPNYLFRKLEFQD